MAGKRFSSADLVTKFRALSAKNSQFAKNSFVNSYAHTPPPPPKLKRLFYMIVYHQPYSSLVAVLQNWKNLGQFGRVFL